MVKRWGPGEGYLEIVVILALFAAYVVGDLLLRSPAPAAGAGGSQAALQQVVETAVGATAP